MERVIIWAFTGDVYFLIQHLHFRKFQNRAKVCGTKILKKFSKMLPMGSYKTAFCTRRYRFNYRRSDFPKGRFDSSDSFDSCPKNYQTKFRKHISLSPDEIQYAQSSGEKM